MWDALVLGLLFVYPAGCSLIAWIVLPPQFHVARLLGTWFAGVLAPALVGMIIFGLEGGGDEDGPFLFFALMVAVPTIISLATIGAFERRKRRS